MRRILVVQNAPGEGLGYLAAPLDDARLETRITHAYRGEPVPWLGAASGLIVLGGPWSAYDTANAPWLADVMRLIREAHTSGRPVLGICLGAQLAAQALGGRAFRGPAPEVGVKPVVLSSEAKADQLLRGWPSTQPAFHLHHDTYERPPGAQRLASSAAYAEQAFKLGNRTYGLQFHIEWDPATLGRLLPAEGDDLAASGASIEALLKDAEHHAPAFQRASEQVARAFAELLAR